MMLPKRIASGLAGFLCVLLAGLSAFGEDEVRDLPAMQLFDPADIRPYDGWDTQKDGFYFTFDGLGWTISAPKKTTIGFPGLTRQVFYTADNFSQVTESNTEDTGLLRAKQKDGDRIEFGYTDEHHGILVDTFELDGQTQNIYGTDIHVVFQDVAQGPQAIGLLEGFLPFNAGTPSPELRPLPVAFASLAATNRTYTNGVEVLYTYRDHPMHNGGDFMWMVGGRYVRFDDEFVVVGLGGNLGESAWDTAANNRIWGPEVGVRWSKEFGRFGISSEGRFMAGVNDQAIRQNGELASILSGTQPNNEGEPYLMHATTFGTSVHLTEFCPLVEFRAEGHVQLTRLISAKVGWTGIFMDNIARASDMILYQVPNMGILPGNNKQPVFMQGFNIGLELNH